MFLGVPTGNPFDNDTCAWITLNSPMKKKYGSKLSIATWIHSHVEEVKCCFSSIDLHTQNTLSKMYPDILGMVCQIGKDGSLEKHDYFGLTRKGHYGLSKCKKSGTKFHEGCYNESFYTSYKHLITTFEGPLEVHDYFILSSNENEVEKNNDFIQIEPAIESESPKVYSFGYDMKSDFVKNLKRKCDGCNTFFFAESFHKHLSHSKKCSDALDEDNKKSEVSKMKNLNRLKTIKKPTRIQSSETTICEGCQKPFKIKSLLKHVSHSKKCKSIYGPKKFEIMKQDKRCETNSKYYRKNQENLKKYLPKVRENMRKLRAEERERDIKESLKDIDPGSNLHVVNCKGCDGSFMSNKILKHISQADECFNKYDQKDLSLLEKMAKDRKHETEEKWRQDNLSQVIDQEKYRYDFYKDKIKSGYKKKDISALPWNERNKLRTARKEKKKELQLKKWERGFQSKSIEEAKNKIKEYLKGEPMHTSNLNGKNCIEEALEPWIEHFCKKKVTEELNEEYKKIRNDIQKAWDTFEKEISEVVEKVKMIVSGSIDKNQEKAREILCKRKRMAGELVDELNEKIRDFWHNLGKQIGKSMKVIGDQIEVKFIYLFEDPINPRYYWRNRGSKKETVYDRSSNDSDSDDPDK